MNWWKDGLSLSESKVSITIIGFIISLAFAIYFTFTNGDSPSNFTNIVLTLIWAIAGVNGVQSVSEIISQVRVKDEKTITSTEDYEKLV